MLTVPVWRRILRSRLSHRRFTGFLIKTLSGLIYIHIILYARKSRAVVSGGRENVEIVNNLCRYTHMDINIHIYTLCWRHTRADAPNNCVRGGMEGLLCITVFLGSGHSNFNIPFPDWETVKSFSSSATVDRAPNNIVRTVSAYVHTQHTHARTHARHLVWIWECYLNREVCARVFM